MKAQLLRRPAAPLTLPPTARPLYRSARTSCFNFWSIPAAFSLTSLGLLAALGGFTAHPAASQLVLRSIQHGCYAAGATALASYASRRLSQLRQLEGLPEGPLSDWWSYFWCPGLTVSLEGYSSTSCATVTAAHDRCGKVEHSTAQRSKATHDGRSAVQ